MDSLDSLPTSDDETELPPQQAEVMNKFFGASQEKPKASPWKDMSKWKTVGLATVAFLLISNPWIQAMLNHVPYFGGNDMTSMLFSVILFVLLMTVIVMFA